jgi:M6 family metalloprotease-like protein
MDTGEQTIADRRGTDLAGVRTVRLEPPGESPEASPATPEKPVRRAKMATGRGGKKKPPSAPPRPRAPEHIALFDNDALIAASFGEVIRIYDADRFATGEAKPMTEIALKRPVVSLVGHGDAVLAGLDDGTIWRIVPTTGARPEVNLIGVLDGAPRAIFPIRDAVLVVVESDGAARLVEVMRSGAPGRSAALPFSRISHISVLDERGTLVVVDERHGAHLVRFTPRSDASTLEVTALDADARVTAVAAASGGWHVIARKGGEVRKARLDTATGTSLDDVCARLREALRACGCACHGHPHGDRPDRPGQGEPCGCGEPDRPGGYGRPGKPGGPDKPGEPDTPDGGRPPGGDDEPCGRKHRARLGWSVATLARTGPYLTALSAKGDRIAVLDTDLNVLVERYVGRAVVELGSTASDRIAVLDRRQGRLETWQLRDYIVSAGIRPAFTPKFTAPALPTSVFHGQPTSPASPNPDLRIAVMPVIEPGQVFSDADQSKLHALMQEHAYSIAEDYFRENSFETLTTEFSVLGVDIGGTGKPLALPDSFASYFWDEFRAGGLLAEMPAAWPTPLVFDGREELTIRTHPSKGSSRDYDVPFAALWTRTTHSDYPVDVSFTGSETLTVDVTDAGGTAHTLTLDFGALNESHAQGDDENAFLNAVGQHVTDAIRAAEAAAGSGQVIQDVVFRRVRMSSDDSEFGRLLGQWRISGGGGARGSIEIAPPGGTVPAGLVAVGLAGSGASSTSGTVTSEADIADYLSDCLDAAIRDAGEGPGLNDTQLHNEPTTDEDAATQLVSAVIRLTNDYGGKLANIERVSSSGLGSTGWSASTSQDGSETSYNSRNALRHSEKLSHDTFTAAMDRIRSQGAWDREAVRTQFSVYDGLMIAFVGSCPTSVPAADRWQCSDAVDQDRFRMFVRRHYATDQNDPDSNATPVAMPTDLIIGQRFDRFDAAVMTHEIGHGLTLPDLYYATGFRDDVQYIDAWCNMAGGNSNYNHFCAWSKWAVGWIPESSDPDVNRVIDVPMPEPSGISTTEAWLVPVEYWDNSIRADVIAAVGTGLPIGQMMKIHIGSDGGVIDIAEFRAMGDVYSQNLSPVPSVVVTNVLDPETDRRWAVNGLYRRAVHLLNDGTELTAPGDRWDFAAGAEFPLKGCVAEVVDIQTIRGGSVPICHLRIEREAAEFVDLYFQDNLPSWRSPDIWVDWRGDNADPDDPRIYPEGTPTDQGEAVRYPGSGTEPHFLVTRPHNSGNVHAEDVRVRWFICDPPGAGDDGRWVERDTSTLPQLDDDTWEAVPFSWAVTPETDSHQCLRAEIIDWRIPTGVDPATGDTVALAGDDVVLQNNIAQKNVFDFEAAT